MTARITGPAVMVFHFQPARPAGSAWMRWFGLDPQSIVLPTKYQPTGLPFS